MEEYFNELEVERRRWRKVQKAALPEESGRLEATSGWEADASRGETKTIIAGWLVIKSCTWEQR